MQTKYKVVILLLLLIPFVSTPVGTEVSSTKPFQNEVFQVSQTPDAAYISDVPYVWQEVNGYCMSAAFSMVLQSMGIDLTLDDLVVGMGTAFSAMYVGIDDSRMFLPGVMIQQPAYLEFFCELYGLEMTRYLDPREPFGSQGAWNFDRFGLEWINFADSSSPSPFDVLKETISAGIPFVVAADIFYLPPEDYDIFRQFGVPLDENGIAHAITIVGYNDTSNEIYIQDPGVGLFNPHYGYPEDGRWNYTMSYYNFNRAWKSAGYVTFKVTQESDPVENFEATLGEFLVQKLRGNRTAYFDGLENLYYLSPGKDAYSGLGLDLTVDCIADYARYFMEVDKDEALLRLGHMTEMFLTMQYHGYHTALDSIQGILPRVELTDFIDAADDALPHFEALTCVESIQSAAGVISRDTLLFSTFEDIALDFQSSGDLEGSIGNHQERLNDISEHLFAIADSWDTAADALEEALDLPVDTEPLEGSMPVVIGGSVIIILVVAIYLVKQRK
ncbi:MAG: C39 family peptidase [Candidatus Thorarchaeota archaeon]